MSSALLLFVALVAPDVVCPDRRQRVLPLIFARPLTGVDYVVAKVGAIAAIVFGFSFLPQVVLFVGQMLVSDGALDYFRDNADVLWQVPVSVALLAVYYAVVGVAIASLTDRRIVAGAAIIGLFSSRRRRRGSSSATSAATDRRPRSSTSSPCRCTSATSSSSATSTRPPLAGVDYGGPVAARRRTSSCCCRLAVLLWRYRWVER